MLQTLSESFVESATNLWVQLFDFIPLILGALVILIVGLIIASALGKFAKKIMTMTNIDAFSQKIGLESEIASFGIKLNFSELIGWVVKWFFIIATFIAVVDVLNIPQLTIFLQNLVMYLPNVIVAIIILAVGLIIGKVLKNTATATLGKMKVSSNLVAFLGTLAKWAIFTFALMAALVQLGIASNLIQIVLTGLVAMLAIAGGLAFGLGGRDHATKVLNWIEKEMGHKD